MAERTAFPRVFWIANGIEILERFAYYGIYFGFGIYMASLGYSRSQLGIVQSLFLFLSYGIPVAVISAGVFGDVKPSSQGLASPTVTLDIVGEGMRGPNDQAVNLVPCGPGCAHLLQERP